MVKHFGIVTLMALGLAFGASSANAQYATPPPPPAPPATVVPPPANPGVVPQVATRCGSLTIRCPGTPRTRVIYRTRYRYRYRRCPRRTCPRRYNKRLHRKGGPYYGFGLGYFGLMKPEGAYQHLKPKVLLSAHVGWNFNPIFGLELGYQGGLMGDRNQALGAIKNPSLHGVTLDLKFRFIRPRRYNRVIPYLQTGLGVYVAQAVKKATTECGKDKAFNMAYGGGVQVGGGIDFYLADWAVLGAKVLYRPLFMSAMRCGPGSRCGDYGDNPLRKLHALTAELSLAFTWPG